MATFEELMMLYNVPPGEVDLTQLGRELNEFERGQIDLARKRKMEAERKLLRNDDDDKVEKVEGKEGKRHMSKNERKRQYRENKRIQNEKRDTIKFEKRDSTPPTPQDFPPLGSTPSTSGAVVPSGGSAAAIGGASQWNVSSIASHKIASTRFKAIVKVIPRHISGVVYKAEYIEKMDNLGINRSDLMRSIFAVLMKDKSWRGYSTSNVEMCWSKWGHFFRSGLASRFSSHYDVSKRSHIFRQHLKDWYALYPCKGCTFEKVDLNVVDLMRGKNASAKHASAIAYHVANGLELACCCINAIKRGTIYLLTLCATDDIAYNERTPTQSAVFSDMFRDLLVTALQVCGSTKVYPVDENIMRNYTVVDCSYVLARLLKIIMSRNPLYHAYQDGSEVGLQLPECTDLSLAEIFMMVRRALMDASASMMTVMFRAGIHEVVYSIIDYSGKSVHQNKLVIDVPIWRFIPESKGFVVSLPRPTELELNKMTADEKSMKINGEKPNFSCAIRRNKIRVLNFVDMVAFCTSLNNDFNKAIRTVVQSDDFEEVSPAVPKITQTGFMIENAYADEFVEHMGWSDTNTLGKFLVMLAHKIEDAIKVIETDEADFEVAWSYSNAFTITVAPVYKFTTSAKSVGGGAEVTEIIELDYNRETAVPLTKMIANMTFLAIKDAESQE